MNAPTIILLICLAGCTLGPAPKRPAGTSIAKFHRELKEQNKRSFWERNPWIPFSVVFEGFHEARE